MKTSRFSESQIVAIPHHLRIRPPPECRFQRCAAITRIATRRLQDAGGRAGEIAQALKAAGAADWKIRKLERSIACARTLMDQVNRRVPRARRYRTAR